MPRALRSFVRLQALVSFAEKFQIPVTTPPMRRVTFTSGSRFKSWMPVEDIMQSVPDFPCHVCGEACSTNQTWVEDALKSAEIVPHKHFGLDAPG